MNKYEVTLTTEVRAAVTVTADSECIFWCFSL